jgi:mono/diheme cytochrome c family protein
MIVRHLVLIGTVVAGGVVLVPVGASADPDDGEGAAESVGDGRLVYDAHCASCHGPNLEGQPDWQTVLPSGRLPAPPHDASGHTWHHPDGVPFRIVKEGIEAVVGGNESDMAGFGDILSDAEIAAALAYIKSTWPDRERSYQERVSEAERATGG